MGSSGSSDGVWAMRLSRYEPRRGLDHMKRIGSPRLLRTRKQYLTVGRRLQRQSRARPSTVASPCPLASAFGTSSSAP
jgi:hypothetical protein